VELFARRRAARHRITAEEFADLRRDLVDRFRALGRAANDVEAAFYSYVEDLVQPWLDLQALRRAERDILFDLLIRCRQVEAELGTRSWMRMLRSRAVPALLGAMFFAIILLCIDRSSLVLWTILNQARGLCDEAMFRTVHSTDLERLFAVGLVLIAVSIYSMSRTAQS
jgi:hypothetical protein